MSACPQFPASLKTLQSDTRRKQKQQQHQKEADADDRKKRKCCNSDSRYILAIDKMMRHGKGVKPESLTDKTLQSQSRITASEKTPPYGDWTDRREEGVAEC